MAKREINHVTVRSAKLDSPMHLALIADLHNGPYEDVLPHLRSLDGILILGDLVDRHRDTYDRAVRFLQDAPTYAPTYYVSGNHERKLPSREAYWPHVLHSSVTLLDGRWVRLGSVVLGGMASAAMGEQDDSVVRAMAQEPGFRLLMCHHPEYYEPWIAPWGIDLTLSGHAHGGQIRIGGQGLFAPGQGLLPKLTAGFYHNGRLLVSRGMTNAARMVRLWNPCELILLHLLPETEGDA